MLNVLYAAPIAFPATDESRVYYKLSPIHLWASNVLPCINMDDRAGYIVPSWSCEKNIGFCNFSRLSCTTMKGHVADPPILPKCMSGWNKLINVPLPPYFLPFLMLAGEGCKKDQVLQLRVNKLEPQQEDQLHTYCIYPNAFGGKLERAIE